MNINYRSFNDMNTALLQNLNKLPNGIDLVVGIPRSGMLPANLLALYLNKPFSDLDSFVEGRIYQSGLRGAFSSDSKNTGHPKVLIMDDSIYTGAALVKVKEKLSNSGVLDQFDITMGVVYATKDSKDLVDFYCEVVEFPRVFQWNIFHHKRFIPNSCFDIDGVLCPNPPIDDDGPLYTDYITNAPVLYKPSVPIGTLVSCRLEKYRGVTEEWLKRNGIHYGKLIMLDFPDKESRVSWGKHGIYKGEVYRDGSYELFVESSLAEARDIVAVSHKPVFCTETFQMYYDTGALNTLRDKKSVMYKKIKNKITHLKNKIKRK